MTTNREPTPAPPRNAWQRAFAFLSIHPFLALFCVLGPAMVVILLIAMQSVALEPSQRLAMVLATLGLGAACAWIISIDE